MLRLLLAEEIFQSTRPSRDGTKWQAAIMFPQEFQSTRPSRDGTKLIDDTFARFEFQSTRPSRDGTEERIELQRKANISIHPPLAGRDIEAGGYGVGIGISIHPPLAGRDQGGDGWAMCGKISIHPPLAGRDSADRADVSNIDIFQSTRPSRDGTIVWKRNLKKR